MLTREDIIKEIRKTAVENRGIPLGIRGFENQTGIKRYEWQKYWPRFGDAVQEAGYAPNQLTPAYKEEFIIGKMIGLIRKLNKFPTYGELRVEKINDSEFPHAKTLFESKEQKQKLAKIIGNFSIQNLYVLNVRFLYPLDV